MEGQTTSVKTAIPLNDIELRRIIDTLNIAISTGKIQIINGQLSVTDGVSLGLGTFEYDAENKRQVMRNETGDITVSIEA